MMLYLAIVLEQAQQSIQNQVQTLAQVQLNTLSLLAEPSARGSTCVCPVLVEVEAGLQDPNLFRWRHTQNRPKTRRRNQR